MDHACQNDIANAIATLCAQTAVDKEFFKGFYGQVSSSTGARRTGTITFDSLGTVDAPSGFDLFYRPDLGPSFSAPSTVDPNSIGFARFTCKGAGVCADI